MAHVNPTLYQACVGVSDKFNLKIGEVLEAATSNIDVASTRAGSDATMRTGSDFADTSAGDKKMVSLQHYLPAGKRLSQLSVAELASLLQQTAESGDAGDDENCVPFLLRHVLGEFHYGQRATGKLPGQAPAAAPKDGTKVLVDEEGEHGSAVNRAFNVLAKEAKFRHLHQVSGWVDMEDKSVWDRYVKDVMDGKLRDGDRVYEAGCGVLAFLRGCQLLAPNIVIGGSDGASATIDLIKDKLIEPEYKDNFYAGMLPKSLDPLADESWDVVVCNSVFQYFPDRDTAKTIVDGMLRVAKRYVVIADVCDEKYIVETNKLKDGLGWTDGMPTYLGYPKKWWEDNFEGGPHLVSIRHVETKEYKRRVDRYCVYIEKNARP